MRHAVWSGSLDVVKFAMEKELDAHYVGRNNPPYTYDFDETGALDEAIGMDRIDIVSFFIEMVTIGKVKPYILCLQPETQNDLVEKNNRDVLKLVIDGGNRCQMAVRRAARTANFDMIRFLESKDLDMSDAFIEASSSANTTSEEQVIECLELLADEKMRNRPGFAADLVKGLGVALRSGNARVADWFVDAGANVHELDLPLVRLWALHPQQREVIIAFLAQHPEYKPDWRQARAAWEIEPRRSDLISQFEALYPDCN
ncbi:hypothetical protein BDZ88DRAFT_454304 [Geranomyces variabilis]|nr:hypothetical protein BDZ88DRAFT_454304 [Geranomyces variabilis]KAJ3136482.1 hypothetical protein HDU90_003195 [Geranomyces variabilis]